MKTLLTGIAVALISTSAGAAQLDSLKGLMGGSNAVPASGSATNAAGLIQYCMTNNYLGGESGAAGVKDKLLGSLGGDQQAAGNDATGSTSTNALLGKLGGKTNAAAAPTQDAGYLQGAQGILKSSDGKTLNLANAGQDASGTGDLKAKLTKNVCKAVLKQGKKMASMGK